LITICSLFEEAKALILCPSPAGEGFFAGRQGLDDNNGHDVGAASATGSNPSFVEFGSQVFACIWGNGQVQIRWGKARRSTPVQNRRLVESENALKAFGVALGRCLCDAG
jgi:hypothetical protein